MSRRHEPRIETPWWSGKGGRSSSSPARPPDVVRRFKNSRAVGFFGRSQLSTNRQISAVRSHNTGACQAACRDHSMSLIALISPVRSTSNRPVDQRGESDSHCRPRIGTRLRARPVGPATPLRGRFNQNGSSRRRSLILHSAIFCSSVLSITCLHITLADVGLCQTVAVAIGPENTVRMYPPGPLVALPS